MSFFQDFWFTKSFNENVTVLSQQMEQKFRGTVREEYNIVGKTHAFERIGPTDFQQIQTRHAPTPVVSTPFSRRQVTFTDFVNADLIDDIDKVKMLIDPQSHIAGNIARSRNRRVDDTIIAAFNANAVSVDNQDATTNVALPSAQIITNGGTNMTLAKWRQAKQIFDSNDVPHENRHIAISPIGLQALLGDSQVTSTDYNSVHALVRGEIPGYLGMNVIITTRLPFISGSTTVRACFAWQRDGMGLGVLLDKGAEIDRRPDLNNSIQVLEKLTLGATRIEEVRVVEIDIDETK